MAVGALPDGTPVIVSGGDDGTVRVWRLADGTPVGEPLTGHDGAVKAVAVGALPDGTPVIVSGGGDGTVRVWRLADGTPVVPPLDLPESVRAVAVHGNVIVTAAGADIAVHQPALPRPMRSCCSISGTTTGRRDDRIMAGYPVHRPANPWHGHRLLRRANIQPSVITGHSVHPCRIGVAYTRADSRNGCTHMSPFCMPGSASRTSLYASVPAQYVQDRPACRQAGTSLAGTAWRAAKWPACRLRGWAVRASAVVSPGQRRNRDR